MLTRERLVAGGLLALAVVGELPVLRSLATPDLNWCYPYLLPDSYDWINNGLFWAGAAVAPSLRPPVLPLLIAALHRLGALSILPLLNFLALGVSAALLYRLLRHRHGLLVTALATWVFFANSFVQELAKYVMAEVWALPFLLGAALAFLAAEADPRAYAALGALVGLGALVHYAAIVAGAGLWVALALTRRGDLKRREARLGMLLAALPAAGWLVLRWGFYAAHPGGRTHVIEQLVSFSAVNVRFYLVTGAALLGLPLVPLFVAGLVRLLQGKEPGIAGYRAATLAPLVSLTLLFVFFYRWVDKRFLVYAYPFAVCLLAQGLEGLLAWSRRGLLPRVVAAGILAGILPWNQIRYPEEGLGMEYLALTPRDFADLAFHIEGARVTRVHRRVAEAFTGGLFDTSLAPRACDLKSPDRVALLSLREDIDRLLPRGDPVGFHAGPGWPEDYWSAVNRLSNVLLRPVVRPDQAHVAVALGPVPGTHELAVRGAYRFVAVDGN